MEQRVRLLCEKYGTLDTKLAVEKAVQELLAEANISSYPVSLERLESMLGVTSYPASLSVSARLVEREGSYTSEYADTDSETRQRFSRAHELVHVLFSRCEAECSKTARTATSPYRMSTGEEEEALCQLASARILMPEALFRQHASTLKVGAKHLQALAAAFKVSIAAAAIRAKETSVWSFAYVEWLPVDKSARAFLVSRECSTLPVSVRRQLSPSSHASIVRSYSERMSDSGRTRIRYRGRKRYVLLDCWFGIVANGKPGVRSVVHPLSPFR